VRKRNLIMIIGAICSISNACGNQTISQHQTLEAAACANEKANNACSRGLPAIGISIGR
jgi:hypothetical protein